MNINYDTCTKEELIESHREQAWKIEQLTHRLKELERAIVGRKSKRFAPEESSEQLLLSFLQGEQTTSTPADQEKEQISYTRRKQGKKQHPVR